ncbi:hypothetical protein QJQ45_013025 [Haematococcus lacustris]|nr:hypothetical protein QJQ45_013025 [Haematococcus lacustris]
MRRCSSPARCPGFSRCSDTCEASRISRQLDGEPESRTAVGAAGSTLRRVALSGSGMVLAAAPKVEVNGEHSSSCVRPRRAELLTATSSPAQAACRVLGSGRGGVERHIYQPKPRAASRLLQAAGTVDPLEVPFGGARVMWRSDTLVRTGPAKAKPAPQPGRWLDMDCNATLNTQRIGERKWRPLELCWWPEQGKLPAKDKEYPGLGYKRLRDKPPTAQQQQQQPAAAQ